MKSVAAWSQQATGGWANKTFAVALFVIAAEWTAHTVLILVDIAHGDVGTRFDPQGGSASYVGAAFGAVLSALIAAVAGFGGTRKWPRTSLASLA